MVKRILDIAYKHKLSHLGSYFTALPIIDEIYKKMDKDDIFILSSGHAALALYVCLEKYRGQDAEALFLKHGGHPHWDEKAGIHCSTGSLGMGILIALGRAIANPKRKVYVLLSDGECAEGSVWEALKTIQENNITNIEIHVNINGYSAYKKVNPKYLMDRLFTFLPKQMTIWLSGELINIKINGYNSIDNIPEQTFSFLKGLDAHYKILNDEDYQKALKELI